MKVNSKEKTKRETRLTVNEKTHHLHQRLEDHQRHQEGEEVLHPHQGEETQGVQMMKD